MQNKHFFFKFGNFEENGVSTVRLLNVLNDPRSCYMYVFQRRMPESDWHQERVDWLKLQVMQHEELNIARFKHASEVADMIKEVV